VPAIAASIPFYSSPIFNLQENREMEALPSSIRGLINDLTRTLTGTLVHMDDLLLHLDTDSGEFDDARLANHQLERALEFFIELRSEYMIRQESIQEQAKSYKLTAIEKLMHNFNNLLAVVVGYCDMVQNNLVDVRHITQIPAHIYESIQKSHYLLNEPIFTYRKNVSTNLLKISHKKIKLDKSKSAKKYNMRNKILLVEDNEGVRDFITTVLYKYEYAVIGCSEGGKALAIFELYKADFDLCMVDVGLPDIEGPDLVKKLLLQKPNINVLFTSGYNEIKLKECFPLIGPHQILIKPFRLDELLTKVGSMMPH
jgi:CheY-like chemotaxis protein